MGFGACNQKEFASQIWLACICILGFKITFGIFGLFT